jgi:type I restriction enzyme, S subunit
MSVPIYPLYKHSGVRWIGEVPATWETWKLLTIARLESGHTPSRQHPEYWREDECVIPWFTLEDIGFLRDERNIFVERTCQQVSQIGLDNSSARLLPYGTVILSRTASVGFSGIMQCAMAVSQDFAAWICGPRIQAYYLLCCLRAMKQEFRRLMMGSTHQTIYMPDIQAFRVPVPPIAEQSAICAFLDRETDKIDALVAEQERLMALLKEKRQAVISHAVTKGMDPTAPMKHSGVEWLGEVPTHWDVVPVAYRYEVQLGRMLNEERSSGENLRPYLRVFDVQWGKINVEDLPAMDFPEDARARYRLRDGDLLVNEGGSYVGRSAIWRAELEECYYQKALHRLRAHSKIKDTAEFFFYIMEFATQYGVFVASGNQTTIDHLTAEQLRRYQFAFPPLPEQIQIIEFIQRQCSKLDILSADAESTIALLKERRAALISAAVTGKIDVRQAAARQDVAA